jgi:hypothetical protein
LLAKLAFSTRNDQEIIVMQRMVLKVSNLSNNNRVRRVCSH